MKNVVSKVLMMFVMSFTLLVSCSYALEFNTVPYPEACTYTAFNEDTEEYTAFEDTFASDTGYTISQISAIVLYSTSSDLEEKEIYTTAMNVLSSKGYHYFHCYTTYSNGSTYNYYYIVKTSVGFDAGCCFSNTYYCTRFLLNEGDSVYLFGKGSGLYVVDTPGLYTNFFQGQFITYYNSKVKNLNYNSSWSTSDGYMFEPTLCNAVGEVSSGGDSSYTPTFSDDEIAGIVNTFINSEDFIAHRSSGYDDFFITYDNRAEQYYAYLYKSAYDLGMVYGTFDENGNFEPNGLSEGEGYNIFCSSDSSNFLSDLWSNIKRIFQPSQYLCFRINHVINKVHYIATYSDNTMFKTSQMIFTTSERSIVYSTKDIKLIVRDGENTLVDTDNSYTKDVLIDSSTGEEYQFELPSTPVAETPWERFLSAITSIPKNIASAFSEMLGYTKVAYFISPLITAVAKILGVLLASISFIGRAITFVYTLPTIEASSAMFTADVATNTTGLVFTGNNWGQHFLSGLTRLKNLSWNGINLWSFFEAFVLALLVIFIIKLVRKHYHV